MTCVQRAPYHALAAIAFSTPPRKPSPLCIALPGDSGSVEDSAPTLREAMNRARARAHALTSGEPRQPSGRDKG